MDREERRKLAAKVEKARAERGYTRQQVADLAGVSLGMVDNLALGKSVPQQAKLVRILSVLKIEGDAEETRESWSPDVKVFLDVMGAFLTALPEDERYAAMRTITSDIIQRTRTNGQQMQRNG